MVCDVLRMKKNICLCRHFHRLDKHAIARSNHIRYIDVWPLNVFDPTNNNPFDVVSLFMLQLACIINMLPKWKKLELRVFLCEPGISTSHRYLQLWYNCDHFWCQLTIYQFFTSSIVHYHFVYFFVSSE